MTGKVNGSAWSYKRPEVASLSCSRDGADIRLDTTVRIHVVGVKRSFEGAVSAAIPPLFWRLISELSFGRVRSRGSSSAASIHGPFPRQTGTLYG